MARLNYIKAQTNELKKFKPDLLVSESTAYYGHDQKPELVWRNDELGIYLYQGDSLILLDQINKKYPEGIFDLIFADPPYFLGNDGITCKAGKMVSVNKGEWDKLTDIEQMHEFNKSWLLAL